MRISREDPSHLTLKLGVVVLPLKLKTDILENIETLAHLIIDLPPDQAGLLDTGTTHGPLVKGGTVGDGPQCLPGYVLPLRGGEHRPKVPGPDQQYNLYQCPPNNYFLI